MSPHFLAPRFLPRKAMRFDAMASSMAAFHEANAEAMTELGEEAGSLRESVAALQAAISGAVVDANGASDEAAATLEFGVAGGNTAVRETLAGLVATIEVRSSVTAPFLGSGEGCDVFTLAHNYPTHTPGVGTRGGGGGACRFPGGERGPVGGRDGRPDGCPG